MRKLFFILFACLIFSCKSNKVESLSENKNESLKDFSFVNTGISEDGGIYTTCVFKEIKKVVCSNSDGKEITLNSKDYSYNSDNANLVLNDESLYDSNNSFHIEGIYQNPPVFVLHSNSCPDPLVLYEEKIMIRGTDYDYDPVYSKILFKNECDLDNDSFLVFWFTKNRECTFGNKIEKFENEYSRIIDEWIKSFY